MNNIAYGISFWLLNYNEGLCTHTYYEEKTNPQRTITKFLVSIFYFQAQVSKVEYK